MPELPEVETVVGDLRGAVTGARIRSVAAENPRVVRYPDPKGFRERLRRRTICEVGRRGKFIVMTLDSEETLVVHLGMTGHLTVVDAQAPLPRHTHVRATLDDGRELRFDDARRFGRMVLGAPAELAAAGAMPPLGVEPLSPEFTAEYVDGLLRRSRRPLKSALLDQAGIAGLGNIYIDEACFRAGVRPTRRCFRLTRAERRALHAAIPEVLAQAIRNRGSSIDDYRDVWNAKGSNQEALLVYGRGGEACVRCGTTLRRTLVAQRTTVFCPQCQPR